MLTCTLYLLHVQMAKAMYLFAVGQIIPAVYLVLDMPGTL